MTGNPGGCSVASMLPHLLGEGKPEHLVFNSLFPDKIIYKLRAMQFPSATPRTPTCQHSSWSALRVEAVWRTSKHCRSS